MAIEFKNGIVVDGTGTVLDIQGTQGQLFSITDSLTGDLFSVSDISGVPILNVNSSGAVDIDGTLTISTIAAATTDTDKFLVSDSGVLKFRTGAEVLSDIGGQASGSYLTDLGTAIVDGDFSGTSGFMKKSSAGVYALDTNTYSTATGVEDNADVTDATNVAAAGAVMDGDFTAQGFMVRGASSGSYSIDTNTYITSQRAIDDSPTDGSTTTSISSNWAFDNVKTAVPSGAVFTDTQYGVATTSATGLGPILPNPHGGKFLRGDGTYVVPSYTSISGLATETYVDTAETDAIAAAATAGDLAYVALGGSTMTGLLTLSSNGVSIGGHTMNDIDITSEVSNADDHLMSAMAIKNKIEDYGYITSSGNTSGNAATATALATARSIGGVSFNGTAAINLPGVNQAGTQNTSGTAAVATAITVTDESSDTSCNVVFVDTATGNRAPKTGTNLTFNSASGILSATGFNGALTGNVTGNVSGSAGGSAKGLSHLDAENAAIVAHGVIVGNADGNGIVQVTGNPTASNKFLRSRGAANANLAPSFESLTYSDLTGTVPTFNQNTSGTAAGLTGLTASRVMVSAGNGTSSVSAITTTELGYLNDVTSNIQTQLNSKTGDQSQADINALAITEVGTISSGTWQGSAISTTYISNLDGTNTGDVCSSDHANAGYVTSSGITAVNDSTASTNFPVVFHDESNGLLDDTGTFMFNPGLASLYVPEYITHTGDTDTYIHFSDDNIDIIMGDTDYTAKWNAAFDAITTGGILASFGSDFSNHDSGLVLATTDESINFGSYGSQTWDITTLTYHGDFLKIKADHDGADEEVITLDVNGRIGLNKANPLYGVHDSRASGDDADWYLVNGSIGVGTTPHSTDNRIDITGVLTASNVTSGSDARIKKDIKNIPSHLALNVVKQLQGVRFNWLEENDESDWPELHKPKKENGVMELGFIAQDVEKVLPEVVQTDDYRKGFKTVEYAKMVAVLTEAIKEQQKQIDKLQKQINEL